MEYKLKTIQVKPYVRAYFDRVGFDKEARKVLTVFLQSTNSRFDATANNLAANLVAWRPNISECFFAEFGNELTATNSRDFAAYLEARIIKEFEYAIVAQLSFCKTHNVKFKLIPLLREVINVRLQIDEEDLSLQTIKKRMQRFCEKNKIEYSHLKKLGRNVPKNSAKTAIIPQGLMLLKNWLTLVGISERTFYRSYKNELPYKIIKGKLYIKTLDIAV